MFKNQYPNNTLGQSSMNSKARTIQNAPDTDSRLITIKSSATTINPNLMHDHTRILFQPSKATTVTFNTPINAENKSFHYLVLDNKLNGASKTFNFSNDYIFLDNVGTQNYTVSAKEKLVFYGVYEDGKLKLRVSGESTN
jgi:hypothetical protein